VRPQSRHHLRAQEGAREAPVGVARILDEPDRPRDGIGAQLAAVEAQEGPNQPALSQRGDAGHRGEPGRAAAPEQLQQHGFCLVVAMMGGQQAVTRPQQGGEHPVAGPSRRRLDAERRAQRRDLDLEDPQRDTQRRTHGRQCARQAGACGSNA